MRCNPQAVLLLLLGSLPGAPVVVAAETPTAAPQPTAATQPPAHEAPAHVSPLTSEQLIQILDETVDWYRTLGIQQQSATQPSDLLLLYANRQTADEVVRLAFEIARANAELLSSEASSATTNAAPDRSPAALAQKQQSTAQRGAAIEEQIDAVRRSLASAPARTQSDLNAKLLELQGELAMVKAQKNLLDTMSQFVYENDTQRASVSALKTRINAIAATIPAVGATVAATAPAAAAPSGSPSAAPAPPTATAIAASPRTLGLWDLFSAALGLSQKLTNIDAVDQRTRALQDTFGRIRGAPSAQLRQLSAQSTQLSSAAALPTARR
jgi:hypothetical protein